jgi:hypothetical protein
MHLELNSLVWPFDPGCQQSLGMANGKDQQHMMWLLLSSLEVKVGSNEVQVAPLEIFYLLRGGVHQQV